MLSRDSEGHYIYKDPSQAFIDATQELIIKADENRKAELAEEFKAKKEEAKAKAEAIVKDAFHGLTPEADTQLDADNRAMLKKLF